MTVSSTDIVEYITNELIKLGFDAEKLDSPGAILDALDGVQLLTVPDILRLEAMRNSLNRAQAHIAFLTGPAKDIGFAIAQRIIDQRCHEEIVIVVPDMVSMFPISETNAAKPIRIIELVYRMNGEVFRNSYEYLFSGARVRC